MVPAENTIWLYDHRTEDIAVPTTSFSASGSGFSLSAHSMADISAELNTSLAESVLQKETGSRKRCSTETGSPSSSKACREKLRRDRLKDKFLGLAAVLKYESPSKMDKAVILVDAARMVTQVKDEAQMFQGSNSGLREHIKELKAEKNELREHKQRLKAQKQRLEEQLKAMNSHPQPNPPAAVAFAAQSQPDCNKLAPTSYPSVAIWQFIPPASVDTTEDHTLRPPVA